MSQEPRWYRRSVIGLMLVAFALRLVYLLYTHRTWEDALIAARHAEDVVRGIGLTVPLPAGTRPLQGFSSPLGVLIPLVGDLLSAPFHKDLGLTFFKIVSMFAGAATVWVGAAVARALRMPHVLALTVAAFLAVEHHQILFGMAGMETQVTTLCYLFVLYTLFRGTQLQKGVALGLAMLARPDAAFLVGIALLLEVWRSYRARAWRQLGPVAGGLALLYAPWLLFTTVYYGTPVPNSLTAKALGYPSVWMQMHSVATSPYRFLFRYRALSVFQSLGPSYGGNGTGIHDLGDYNLIALTMLLFLAIGLIAAVRRRHVEAILLCAVVVTYGLYLTLAPSIIFGWYTVPVAAMAVIACCYGVCALAEWLLPQRVLRPVLAGFGLLYLPCLAVCLPYTFRSDRYVARKIEYGVRKPLGLYLGQVSYPSDTIASESLGYTGYYSGRTIYDYPGLCSPVVVRYLREHPQERSMAAMMQHLQPTYVVLRPLEYVNNAAYAWLPQDYERVRVFKAAPGTLSLIRQPGMNVDQEFDVFRRKGVPFRG